MTHNQHNFDGDNRAAYVAKEVFGLHLETKTDTNVPDGPIAAWWCDKDGIRWYQEVHYDPFRNANQDYDILKFVRSTWSHRDWDKDSPTIGGFMGLLKRAWYERKYSGSGTADCYLTWEPMQYELGDYALFALEESLRVKEERKKNKYGNSDQS